jgi:hypothetical protein
LTTGVKRGRAGHGLSADEAAVLRFLIRFQKTPRPSLEQSLGKSVRALAA